MPNACPALLTGYARRGMCTGQSGGAMDRTSTTLYEAPVTSGPIRGLLLTDLRPREVALLDLFQPKYVKKQMKPYSVPGVGDPWSWAKETTSEQDLALLVGGLPTVNADVYISSDVTAIDDMNWLPSRDFKPHLSEYVRMITKFVDQEVPMEISTSSSTR